MSPAAVNKMLKGIYSGEINSRNLPATYYNSTRRAFRRQLKEGFGETKGLKEAYSDLDINVQAFSGAKTYQMTRELQSLRRGTKTYKEFAAKALPVYERYEVWQVAEENTVMAQSQQCKFWKEAERDIDIFPKLRYSTIGDACAICRPLDGIVDYVGSTIWNKLAPTNHFGCLCILIQEPASTRVTGRARLESISADVESKMADYFKTNVGKTNQVFTKEHPYFTEVPKRDRAFANRNFGLPIK